MWNLNDVSKGDYIEVQVINKRGDRNLDGVIMFGKIKDIVTTHKMVRLESGWCCHTKDTLVKHIPANQKIQESSS